MHAALHRFLVDRFLAHDGIPGVSAQLARLRANERLSPDEIAALQAEALRRLLIHARDHCPFWTERFAACGFVPGDVRAVDDLRALPVLTKHDIRARGPEMVATNYAPAQLHECSSGGTTGHLVEFKRDNACLPIKEAAIFRFEQWAGWDFGQWIGLVWPALMDFPHYDGLRQRVRNWLGRRRIMLAFLGEDRAQIRATWARFNERRITLLRAFPGALMSVARCVEEEGLPLPPLKAVISTGEILEPDQRATFERVFRCPVLDSYRSREAGPMAQQCEQVGGMHVSADLGIMEVDADRAVGTLAGGRPYGPILFTDLRNYGMPLIRYEIGDLAAHGAGTCACGRGLPLLEGIGGRLTDILYTVDRRPLAAVGMVPNLFLVVPGDKQMQLVQRSYTDLLLRLTPPALDEATRARLAVRIEEIFGAGARLSCEYVDEIPLTTSGKYRILVNEIPVDQRP